MNQTQSKSSEKLDNEVIAYNKGVFNRLLIAVEANDVKSLLRFFRTRSLTIASKTTPYDWEKGLRIIPQKWLAEAAKAKNIPIDWFYSSDTEIDLKLIRQQAVRDYLIAQIAGIDDED